MKTIPTLALLSLLVACATPRTTTLEERQVALSSLTSIESALTVLYATEHIKEDRYRLAMEQTTALRKEVEESAEKPVSWPDILQRISNLALQWAVVL